MTAQSSLVVVDFNEVVNSGAVILNFGGEPEPITLYLTIREIAERLLVNAQTGDEVSQSALTQIVIDKFNSGVFTAALDAVATPYY